MNQPYRRGGSLFSTTQQRKWFRKLRLKEEKKGRKGNQRRGEGVGVGVGERRGSNLGLCWWKKQKPLFHFVANIVIRILTPDASVSQNIETDQSAVTQLCRASVKLLDKKSNKINKKLIQPIYYFCWLISSKYDVQVRRRKTALLTPSPSPPLPPI